MDFRQLEYVITIARERTLLAAAEKLFISPSALSQHIAKLEEELDTPLFKRTQRGWIPTYAGQVYIDMAHSILDQKKLAYQRISDIADNRVGHFTVGVTAGRGTMMFSRIFPQFKAKYPNVKVGLFEGTVLEITKMITAGKVDIGFLSGLNDYPNVVTRRQAKEDIVLVVPRSHPLAVLAEDAPEGDFATVDLRLFENDEFLLAGEGTTLRILEDRLFSQAGYLPKIAFETPSLLTLNMLSKGGYGLSFIPRFYADDTHNAVYFRTEPSASWDLMVAYRKDHSVTKAEEMMIELVTDYYVIPQK